MRFDLVDLQLFIAIAEARCITGGALRAHLALASASARIKGLEAALGTALLKRGRRGIELTAAGESLLDHARIILHNVEAMRGDLSAYAGGMKATIRLLTISSGLSEYLPKALAAFLGQHPHISIDVEERESAEIAQAIVTGAADLGLAAEHALPDSIERIPFSDDRLVLVAARHDELAKRRQVDFRDVIGRDFVGLTTASALHRQHRRWATAWSPEQISRRLRLDFPEHEMMRISHEAIYQALYVQGRGALRRELSACLRTGRALRMPRVRTRRPGRAFVSPEIMISQRPAEAADR